MSELINNVVSNKQLPQTTTHSTSPLARLSTHNPQISFAAQLESAAVLTINKAPTATEAVSAALLQFNRQWSASNQKLEQRISRLPLDSRELFQLQSQMQTVQIKSQLIAASGEALAGTVKRVQQMGNG